MASYKYRIVNHENGSVYAGIVHEFPESEDDIKKQIFADALKAELGEGFELEVFERLLIN